MNAAYEAAWRTQNYVYRGGTRIFLFHALPDVRQMANKKHRSANSGASRFYSQKGLILVFALVLMVLALAVVVAVVTMTTYLAIMIMVAFRFDLNHHWLRYRRSHNTRLH